MKVLVALHWDNPLFSVSCLGEKEEDSVYVWTSLYSCYICARDGSPLMVMSVCMSVYS